MRDVEHPLGVAEELPRGEDQICLGHLPALVLDLDRALGLVPAVLDEGPGHLGLRDETHRRDPELQPRVGDGPANLAREVGLVVAVHLDRLLGVVAAAAHVEDVDTEAREQLGELDALLDVPGRLAGAVHPLRGRDAHPERQVLGDDRADGSDDLAQETGAVLEAAAVVVGAFLDVVSTRLPSVDSYAEQRGGALTLVTGDRNWVMR